jgi:hypothetical protein
MKNIFKVLPVLVFSMIASQSAHAVMDVSVVGNINAMNLTYDPAPTTKPTAKVGLGIGGLVSFDLGNSLALESGLLLTSRSVGGTDDSSINFSYLQLPVVAKYWVMPQLNFNAGLYYAMGLGDITAKSASGASTDATYKSQGLSSSDFGVILGTGVKVPAGAFSIVGNANYLIGLTNLNDVGGTATVNWGGFQFQAGVSFGI